MRRLRVMGGAEGMAGGSCSGVGKLLLEVDYSVLYGIYVTLFFSRGDVRGLYR